MRDCAVRRTSPDRRTAGPGRPRVRRPERYAPRVPGLRVALCQIDSAVGDLSGNVALIGEWMGRAEAAGADLAVFPELALTGYPPEDLLLRPAFVRESLEALETLTRDAGECVSVVGALDLGRDLHNAAAVLHRGEVVGRYHKQILPNYAVFDEQRYFRPGCRAALDFVIAGVRTAVTICEDVWTPAGPVLEAGAAGCELVVSLNASPYARGHRDARVTMLRTRAADASAAIVYVNLVGGQDELVFDGGSFVVDLNGDVVATAAQFEEALLVVDLDVGPAFRKRLVDPRGTRPSPERPARVLSEARRVPLASPAPPVAGADRRRPLATPPVREALVREALVEEEEVYRALVLGTRDYVAKNRFSAVVVGISGGIDSALVTTIAVDALGPGRVHGVAMPSRFSSPASVADATELAERLGIELLVLPIEGPHRECEATLATAIPGGIGGLAAENLQSRLRGVLLMALSNTFGWLVLTTGNKSELAVGYSTLYGDTAGGFAVIKDVPKTLVYRLADWRNAHGAPPAPIPDAILAKAPSAELRPNQADTDSLPPYDVLDPVVVGYVEDDLSPAEMVERGLPPEVVAQVTGLIDRAEYKRRQSPPGVRVSRRAFGKDRRVPITNLYR